MDRGLNISQRLKDVRRFYALLDNLEQRLGGKRLLANCNGRIQWPQRGVYFFFENNEIRSDSGRGPRVVRVGTHALKAGSRTTLWKRLSQHRGSARSGGGNHRGSIFRLIVGSSLIARDGLTCESWDNRRSSAPKDIRDSELETEQAVSTVIGAMPFLWVAVGDEAGPDSERGIIECGSIALLSNWNEELIDAPSKGWLGHACNRERVQRSGLWNNNHVDEDYDPAFLDIFERHVRDI